MGNQYVIDSSYVVPALLEYSEGNRSEYILLILEQYGINPEDYSGLTNLLDYNSEVITSGFIPNYELLRKGLVEHFDYFLSDFWKSLSLKLDKPLLLDYCGGKGQYSKAFEKFYKNGKAILLDREYGLKIDFEKDPGWYVNQKEKYDIIKRNTTL